MSCEHPGIQAALDTPPDYGGYIVVGVARVMCGCCHQEVRVELSTRRMLEAGEPSPDQVIREWMRG